MFWILFSLLALAAAALVVYAAKPKKPAASARVRRDARANRPTTSRTVTRREVVPRGEPFEAVSIVPGLVPCPAARELRDHRFLIGQEPSLPLADCTSKNCTCRLRQYVDRRHDSENGDRRLGVG
ncbi:MAG: hypothetical protein RIC38_09035, partial [Chromatocurvus sp.]